MPYKTAFKKEIEKAILADKLQGFGTLQTLFGTHMVRYTLSDGSFKIVSAASWEHNSTYEEIIDAQLDALRLLEHNLQLLLGKENDG